MKTPIAKQVNPQPRNRDIESILWDSALESALQTFLVLTAGSIVLGIAGGIFKDFTPSIPPALETQSESMVNFFGNLQLSKSWFRANYFVLVFAMFFVLGIRRRLVAVPKRTETRIRKISRRISRDWVGLILGNAFAAMVLTALAGLLQQFSWTQWCLHWVMDFVLPPLKTGTEWLLGPSLMDSLHGWIHWYKENQAKFTFWFFYFALVCDDLGIPNFKTLGRLLFRRFKKRPQPVPDQLPA